MLRKNFPRLAIILILVLALGFITARYARSQAPGPSCGPRNDVLIHLFTEYGEAVEARAILPDGRVLEVLRAEGGATFTLLATTPDGYRSCLLATGDDWQPVKRTTPNLGAPS